MCHFAYLNLKVMIIAGFKDFVKQLVFMNILTKLNIFKAGIVFLFF